MALTEEEMVKLNLAQDDAGRYVQYLIAERDRKGSKESIFTYPSNGLPEIDEDKPTERPTGEEPAGK